MQEGGGTDWNDFKMTSLEPYGISSILDVKSVYNYYFEDYEKYALIGDQYQTHFEITIPNFYYTLLAVNHLKDADIGYYGAPHWGGGKFAPTLPLSVENFLKMAIHSRYTAPQEKDGAQIQPPAPGAKTQQQLSSLGMLNWDLNLTAERNSVVVLTSDFYQKFSADIKKQKKLYPYFNEISIPLVEDGTVFRDLFRQAKIYDELQYYVGTMVSMLNKEAKLWTQQLVDDGGGSYVIGVTDKGLISDITKARYDAYKFEMPVSKDHPYPLQPEWSKIEPGSGVKENKLYPYSNNSMKLVEFNLYKGKINNPDQNVKIESPSSYKTKSDNPISELANGKNYIDLPHMSPRKGAIDPSAIMQFSSGLLLGGLSTKGLEEGTYTFDKSKPPPMGMGESTFGNLLEDVPAPLVFFGEQEEKNDYISSLLQNKMKKILEHIVNQAKLKGYAVFNNLENYSEILFFEVAKYRSTGNSSVTKTPVQTFILPNDPNNGPTVEYVDSQVNYGMGYYYRIYAHTISIGNNLKRTEHINTTPAQGPQWRATWKYNNEIDLKLLRVPYYNVPELDDTQQGDVTHISDRPPLPPDITFFPYKNISNKIGFWFNLQFGELKMFRIKQLETTLQNMFMDFVQTKDNADPSIPGPGKVLYKTDDYGGTIEIYRTTTRPEMLYEPSLGEFKNRAYEYFKDKKIAEVEVVGPKTFVDDIIPNQDYYYTFRVIDKHSLCSNPSPIYHFKMITSNDPKEEDSVRIGVDAAQPVLFNEILTFEEKKEKQIEKSFKKYLLLEPSLPQTFLSFNNFENNDMVNGFNTAADLKNFYADLKDELGTADVPVYGKKFKIRLTSKQTGRKLDVNVLFKNPRVIEDYTE